MEITNCDLQSHFCIIPPPTHQFRRRIFMFTRRFVVPTLLLFVLLSGASAQTTKVPLTHESMWMMKRVGAPVPSPDGKWVVFSLVEPAYDEKEQVSDLWIVATDGNGKPRR